MRARAAPSAVASPPPISRAAFVRLRELLFQVAGISLADSKQAMVGGRLSKRLRQLGLDSYEAYLGVVQHDPAERQIAIDLLTTNETQFFRERPHFDLLCQRILPALASRRPLRCWSAAASTGQEAYSLAMLLASQLVHEQWEVVGTDISSRVLAVAREGRYEMRLAEQIPREHLQAHCRRGVGHNEGYFVVAAALRQHVRFIQANLNAGLPDIGQFDIALLRNVLIYFPPEVKRDVVTRVLAHLRPGGWLLVGHSESLGEMAFGLRSIAPSVYQRS